MLLPENIKKSVSNKTNCCLCCFFIFHISHLFFINTYLPYTGVKFSKKSPRAGDTVIEFIRPDNGVLHLKLYFLCQGHGGNTEEEEGVLHTMKTSTGKAAETATTDLAHNMIDTASLNNLLG